MQSIAQPGARRSLLVTSALLSPSMALALLSAASLTPATAYAQASSVIPPVLVDAPKPRPKSRAVPSRRTTQRGPAVNASNPVPLRSPEGLAVPANTATISGESAFSRGLGTSDSASLIADIPGGAVWGAGGVSSLPAINGLGADRIQVAINSMLISPACPNEMNPPLSFVNPAMIARMRAYLGVAPVSVGGDYIGGKIDVTTAPPQFATGGGWQSSVMVSGFFRSISNAYGVDATATLANKDTSVTYTGGWVRAGDYKAADGTKVKSTLYETQNHALSISKESFGNLFTVQVGGQFIPYQGYVNQYMDMVYNRSAYINGRYEGVFDWGKLEASGFYHQIRHTMGFIAPDKVSQMPMDTRASDVGYALKATFAASRQDLVRVGNEFYHNRLDDWWDPVAGSMMMGPNSFININDGRRSRLGTFVEWERRWDREWTTLVGLRNDVVWMNTGNVQGYNAMMYGADAAAFNALDHARTDINLDGSALVRYEPDQLSQFELGFARKTRSPNLYERYAWSTSGMAMNMIGWFGDGNGYVGNLDLKPEKAHTASFTAAWHDPAQKVWEFKVTPYYSYVQDYIDVDRCAIQMMSACTAANLTKTNDFVFLRFANHDAWLYGVNLDGKLALWDDPQYGRGVLRGQLGYVRGQRTDGVNLYHVMPINAKLAFDHTLGGWNNGVELQLVGSKDQVNQVHNELTTPSYALVNLRSGYQWQAVRVDFGVDNLFNQHYYLPLGGADLVDYKVVSMMGSSPAYGYNVPGPGRSFNGRLTMKF
ncbi:TonB-dependent receptor plug domain-containing protein [Bradyrhizobium sediminis]|uniref:TonB-dependent receptor plug domain-containing protein n=1 Tax=Bradyrhizobium sediminis TaxID=2840469 RepID=A0A975P445_9BRAD|nr:TonB-dependent receptor [Bradyrhizobium sediminis]QWG25779.1 TonB-dependent receptor plug domain-containing protein [Bradyrhizobium sediminis]